jgi:hypothetical protein
MMHLAYAQVRRENQPACYVLHTVVGWINLRAECIHRRLHCIPRRGYQMRGVSAYALWHADEWPLQFRERKRERQNVS